MQGTNWLQIEKRMHGNLAITVRMDGQTIEISQEDLAVAKAQLTLLGKLRNL